MHIVICRYNESEEIVNEITNSLQFEDNYTVFLYDRGSQKLKINHPRVVCVDDQNVGREETPYLTHLVNYYDELPSKLIFTQGKVDDHLHQFGANQFFGSWVNYIKNLNENFIFDSFTKDRHPYSGCHKYNVEDILKLIYNVDLTFSIYKPLMFLPAAIFAVTHDAVKRHDKQVYKTLLDIATKKIDPGWNKDHEKFQFPWGIERCWEIIFTKDKL